MFVFLILCVFSSYPSKAKQILDKTLEQSDKESALRLKKLELENRDLESKINNNSSWLYYVPTYATSITTLVAVVGLIFTLLKQITELSEERQRQFDEKFSKIVEYLGTDSNTDAGVVMLMNFLKPKYIDINNQVLTLILSHLQGNKHTKDVKRLLIQGLEKSLRIELSKGELLDMDFSNAYLARANLADLSLKGADVHCAVLRYANLSKSNLFRASGEELDLDKAILSDCNLEEVRFRYVTLRKAIFHKARMVSAKIKDSDARGAQFQQALLQGAHFENSKLEGAQFQGANLCDAYFYGATIDDASLRTIARNNENLRRNVHFDTETKERLKKLEKEAETKGNIGARNDKAVGQPSET